VIVAVSDIHLGFQLPSGIRLYQHLRQLIDRGPIDHLVIVGDLIDMWRRWPIHAIRENWGVLDQLLEDHKAGRIKHLHYLIGNHDFTFSQYLAGGYKKYFAQEYSGSSGILRKRRRAEDERTHAKLAAELPPAQQQLVLTSGGRQFLFIHGYQLEHTPDNWLLDRAVYEVLATAMCKTGDKIGALISTLRFFLGRFAGLYNPLERWRNRRFARNVLTSRARGQDRRLATVDERVLIETLQYLQQPPHQRRLSRQPQWWRVQATRYAGLRPDQFLVFGHTHHPFIRRGVANLGSWLTGAATYLTIDAGKPTLHVSRELGPFARFVKGAWYEALRVAYSFLPILPKLGIPEAPKNGG
jgi:UDP-2,3-diacylglucosamine pyrophosphatase LpxH